MENDEEQPLIEDSQVDSTGNFDITAMRNESKLLVQMALPVQGSQLISYINVMAPLLTLGHLGTTYLAAISLATMTANITGFSVGQGFATALDTLCSQGFTGNPDKTALGKHLQRGIVVMFFLQIPVFSLWLFAEPILIQLGQDAEVAKISGVFLKWLMPGLFPYLLFTCVMRYLQGQGIMSASFYVMLISAPINIFLQWFLVWKLTFFGALGAPIATCITNWVSCISIIIYASYIDGYQCWAGWGMA